MPEPSRSNLVIARVGRSSLHSTWLASHEPRNWDLFLCPYQDIPPKPPDADYILGDVIAGPKWTGIREVLNSWDGWRSYERIWLPDDDILASQDIINRMFRLAKALSFDLCAPALHEASYYAHYSTMRNRKFFARRIGFVEIMVPCMSATALDKLLPTLDLTLTGWGWGLDSLWPKLLGYQNIGIMDSTPVLHTRPVGAFRDAGLGERVRAESDHIMSHYQCAQVHTTFAAIGPDMQNRALTPSGLTAELAEGWQYLLENNPAILPWLVQAQQPAAGWDAYPIAGTPSCAAV
ncbi:MAG: hypothetical protein JWP47_1699 [Polaromonas sp.]|nr:hypothetical protein [Polaromonas sp.]